MAGITPISFESIFKSLQKQFYVDVPFPLLPSTLQEAIHAFFRFLEEPDDIKTHIDFTIAPNHRRGDVGFKHRDSNDHIYNDDKSFFHYHPALLGKYADFLEKNPAVSDFMNKAQPIWELAYQTVKNILMLFEKEYPGVTDRVFKAEHPHFLLRFLRYHWTHSDHYLAKPHFDAGSFTLAIAESCPGLRIGSCPDNLKIVEHSPDKALFMLSSNFRKLIDTDKLAAGWHDVIQLDKALVGKPFARWAIVAFIEGYGVEALPRTETHK